MVCQSLPCSTDGHTATKLTVSLTLGTESICPQSASSFLFFIYKVDIQNCRVYNSNVAINVPFLITELYLFQCLAFESCKHERKIKENIVIKG